MAGVLHALATAAVREVSAGGVDWRIRRVSSADLARAQAGALAILPVDPATSKGKGKKKKKEEESPQDFLRRVGPNALVEMAKMTDAMACAAVTHVRGPGEEWEAITLVINRDHADIDKGKLWVGDLTVDIRTALFQAAMAHSTEDGEAVARLESFRETARNAVNS